MLQYSRPLGNMASSNVDETIESIKSTNRQQLTSCTTTTQISTASPPNMTELPIYEQRPESVNPSELSLQRHPTYAKAAAGPSPTSASYVRQGPAITQSSAQLPKGKLTLVRNATDSFQQGPTQPGGRAIKKTRPDAISAPPTSQLPPVNPVISREIPSPPNFDLDLSRADLSLQEWHVSDQLPADRQRRLPPTLQVVTANLGINTHLQIPHTPQQASPAVSTPASTSSVRSARRTPIEMRDQPATFRCAECQKGFHTHDALRHHKRNHGKRTFVCDECDKAFLNPKDLRRHKKKHNKDPSQKFYCSTFGCPYKEKGFQRKDHWQRHMSNQHGVTDSVLGQLSPVNSALDSDFILFP